MQNIPEQFILDEQDLKEAIKNYLFSKGLIGDFEVLLEVKEEFINLPHLRDYASKYKITAICSRTNDSITHKT